MTVNQYHLRKLTKKREIPIRRALIYGLLHLNIGICIDKICMPACPQWKIHNVSTEETLRSCEDRCKKLLATIGKPFPNSVNDLQNTERSLLNKTEIIEMHR